MFKIILIMFSTKDEQLTFFIYSASCYNVLLDIKILHKILLMKHFSQKFKYIVNIW